MTRKEHQHNIKRIKKTTFASGLSSPFGLAFQPVPEPSVMGLLAVGATALLVRRRKTAA